MNNNLPTKRNKSFFTRIFEFFKKHKDNSLDMKNKASSSSVKHSNSSSFSEALKVNNLDDSNYLKKLVETNEDSIHNLSDEQLEQLINIYKNDVANKRQYLNSLLNISH